MNQDRLMQETVEDGSFSEFKVLISKIILSKILQAETAFAKRKLNLLFTAIYRRKC